MATELLKSRVQDAVTQNAMAAVEDQAKLKAFGDFRRDPAAEARILKDWPAAYLYARNVLQAPWKEFEAAMLLTAPTGRASDARAAYNYSNYVLKDRIEGAEKHIAPDASSALDYAKNILQRPWNENDTQFDVATESIMKHPTARVAYQTEMGETRTLKRTG